MSVDPEEPWIARLAGALAGRAQVVGLVCGHIHRAMMTAWTGLSVTVCSSTAPQVALEFGAIDPDRPDGRPMIVADPPGYALHLWTGTRLVTHFESAGDHIALARYDAAMQPVVKLAGGRAARGIAGGGDTSVDRRPRPRQMVRMTPAR